MKDLHRHPLTVELEVVEKKLVRRYRTAHDRWDGPADQLRDLVAKGPDGQSLTLKKLVEWLGKLPEVTDENDEVETSLTGPGLEAAGNLLFSVLFGRSPGAVTPLLERVWPDRGKQPIHAPVRVRVVVKGADAENTWLVGLPWMATQWCGHRLVENPGWTFESCTDGARDTPIQLRSPPTALILAPGADKTSAEDNLRTREHIVELKAIWDAARSDWTRQPGHFEVASSVEAARRALESLHPEVVYFFGHGAVDRGQSHLVFPCGREGKIPVRDLLTLLPELNNHPPIILFLNACNLGRAGWHSAGHLLGGRIPVVLANVSPVRRSAAHELGLHFWEQVVREQRDPVVVAHERPSRGSRAASASLFDRAAVVVTAHYGSVGWRHAPGASGSARMRRAFELDRAKQRGHFWHELDNTLRSGVRVHTVLAHGARGNLMDKAPAQLCDYLESRAGERLQIHRTTLRREPHETLDRLGLEGALVAEARRMNRGVKPGDLGGCLRALAPKRLGDVTPIVWLDAGHVEAGASTSTQLAELTAFLSDVAPRPDDDFWVIGSLAIETGPATASTMKQQLERLGRNTGLRAKMRINVLDPFEDPPLVEVISFLEEEGLDRGVADDLAPALLDVTAGSYAALVDRLDALKTHADYTLLLRKLTREKTQRRLLDEACPPDLVEPLTAAILERMGETRYEAILAFLDGLDRPIDFAALLRKLRAPTPPR